MSSDNEKYLLDISKKYNVEYSDNREKFVSLLTLKGQDYINAGQISKVEELINDLRIIADKWKDKLVLLKYYLLLAQLELKKGLDPIPNLKNALKIAGKLSLYDVKVGILIQIATELYRTKNYKKALKELKKIDKITKGIEQPIELVVELKSRIYWAIDDYINGVKSTFTWLKLLKENLADVKEVFITIVYLLTVISTFPNKFKANELKEIEQEISSTLKLLSESTHLYDNILDNIGAFYTQSIMIVRPSIIKEFTNALLRNARWTLPQKYLYICRKLYSRLVDINSEDVALEVMNQALKFVRDRKYKNIEHEIVIEQIELSNRILHFETFDPLTDINTVNRLQLDEENATNTFYLTPIVLLKNKYPCISYSDLLFLIEKSSKTLKIAKKKLIIPNFSKEEMRGMFLIGIHMADINIDVLMKEEFMTQEQDELDSFYSAVLPYYRMVGVLSKENNKIISDINEIKRMLEKIQKGLNCPASQICITLPFINPSLEIFHYWTNDPNFNSLKQNMIDISTQLKYKYPFSNSNEFLQLFNSDPITIFDLVLRKEEQLFSLSKIYEYAYELDISPGILFNFFQDFIDLFVHRSETRYWKDFFYEYGWNYIRTELRSMKIEQFLNSQEFIEKLLHFAIKLNEPMKLMKSYFFKILYSILTEAKETEIISQIEKLKSIAYKENSQKYILASRLFEELLSNNKAKNANGISLEKKQQLLSLLLEFSSFYDWELSHLLLECLFSDENNIELLLSSISCNDLELIQLLTLLYIVDLNYTSITDRYLLSILKEIRLALRNVQLKSPYITNQWRFAFVKTNRLLFRAINETKDRLLLDKLGLDEKEILEDLISMCEWIDDIDCLTTIAINKMEFLLKKSDYSDADKYYRLIEQYLLWNWDYVNDEKNKEKMDKIQKLFLKLQNQHYL